MYNPYACIVLNIIVLSTAHADGKMKLEYV